MTPFPWDDLRAIVVRATGLADDYVVVDGAPEAIVQPNYSCDDLTSIVRISPRRGVLVGQGRAFRATTFETLGGKEYRVVTQSGHDAWNIDIVIETYSKETYAGDVARDLARAFDDEEIHLALCDAGLSVARIGDAVDTDFTREGKALSAAALEVLVYHKWERVDRTARELIETIGVNKL